MEAPLWSEGISSWPHEREALAFVRTRLPDREPWRAWSNVTFIGEDGSTNEVDLLVVAPEGLFLIEIRSYPGVVSGEGQRWQHTWPDGRKRWLDHPLVLTDTKAKRLRSLLKRQRALRNLDVPFVNGLIFLSSHELTSRLGAIARNRVCGRDPEATASATSAGSKGTKGTKRTDDLPGIVATLKDPRLPGLHSQRIDRPLSALVAQAIDEAGIVPANHGRKVGDWQIGELLDEGPGWQDFAATRTSIEARRRARLYLCGAATTKEDEERLRAEAEREFKLVQDLEHPGIARPLDLVQSERGPALLFDRRDDEVRLDLWAPESLASFGLDDRIDLVRQLVEAVAHAHAHRVTHRALTPRSIVVQPPRSASEPELPAPSRARLLISHWQAGARELATRLSRHEATSAPLGTDLIGRLRVEDQVYLAPELFSAEEPDGVALDVFSLGAIAALIFSGVAPAQDLSERQAMLDCYRGFELNALVDGLPEELAVLVSEATNPLASKRPSTRELLEMLDKTLEELTRPDGADEAAVEGVVDPLSAKPEDRLEGDWRVLRRLGSGASAVALLCTKDGLNAPQVLKVARDDEHTERLRDEARVLESIRHQGIVELLGIERIHGRTTLRLSLAGDRDAGGGMTLADRLAKEGRIGLDYLERFGSDLLEVVDYLESEGVVHRDIKPDNLGVRPRGDHSLHLVLFDFSLARTPDTNLRAGTQGYLDPFLAERPRRRWDAAAERYAAAVTLHEMATGVRPKWGDGKSDPLHLDDELPALDPAQFDPVLRDALVDFFEKALARDPAKRHHTAEEMLRAWRAVFARARRSTTDEDPEGSRRAGLEALVTAALPSSPVTELGLSPSAVAALERVGVSNLEQLRELPPAEWARTSGVTEQIRREVAEAASIVRSALDVGPVDPSASIDRLVTQLVPKPTNRQAAADEYPAQVLLGLEPRRSEQLLADTTLPDPWPGQSEVAALASLDRSGYAALLERSRARWLKIPGLTHVRNDIENLLAAAGGILSADDVALGLLAQHGSSAPAELRQVRARAVVRAALEAESARPSCRFSWRRVAGSSKAVVALRSGGIESEELADYAASLGAEADRLVTGDPLPSPATVVEHLRQVAAPAGFAPLGDHRLVRLAAGCSVTAACSSRFELYPGGLGAERALRLARAALLGSATLSEEDIRQRVATRFPEATALPARPELERLLEDVVGLVWTPAGIGPNGQPHGAGFRLKATGAVSLHSAFGSSGTRYPTGAIVTSASDEDCRQATDTEERLGRHAKSGGYLVVSVRPSQYLRSIEKLARLGAHLVDFDEVMVASLHKRAAQRRIDWRRAILATDALGPNGPNWSSKLLPLVRESLAAVKAQLLCGPRHLALVNIGLLARYDQLGLLDQLRDALRQPASGQSLETLWVLVAAEDPEGSPTLSGRAVPLASAAEHLALPTSWNSNLQHVHVLGDHS